MDEEHGLLTRDEIIKAVQNVVKKYPVNSCYLFGSYARAQATPKSDVDLLVDTPLTNWYVFLSNDGGTQETFA